MTTQTQAASFTLGVQAVFLIVAVALFLLSALGLRFGSISLTDFGLACFAFAFLYDVMKR
ncbi:MAG: hypothetical protein ACXWQ6_01960 [Candidatus Limnocylindrales bacterium]|jgi:hypothetical protein